MLHGALDTWAIKCGWLTGVKPVIAVQILWCFAVFLTFPVNRMLVGLLIDVLVCNSCSFFQLLKSSRRIGSQIEGELSTV